MSKDVDTFKFELSSDPNGPFEDDDDYYRRSRQSIFESVSLEELKQMLKRFPKKYAVCRFRRTTWCSGEAIIFQDGANGHIPSLSVIDLPNKKSCGKAFDGDKVLVEKTWMIADETSKQCGIVKGILERSENIFEKRFICRVDDNNCSLMIPVENDTIKFYIKSPSYHQIKYGTVHIYKRSRGKGTDEVTIKKKKEVQTVKPRETHRCIDKLFTVRFIAWSQYCCHPLGYVEGVVPAQDPLSRYKIMFEISEAHSLKLKEHSKEIAEKKMLYKADYARQDLTDLFVFTIDDKKAKVLDDALSIEKCADHKDCWKVGVHVTDVGSLLPEEDIVDVDARKRFISVDNIELNKDEGKMFTPEIEVSCSLLPNEERLAVSTFFHSTIVPLSLYTDKESVAQDDELSENLITQSAPLLTTIKSKCKLSYAEAQKKINSFKKKKFASGDENNLELQLYHLWKVMWNFRVNRLGSAAFYKGIDKGCSLQTFRNECMARILVEEAMITTNAFTAKFFTHHDVPFFARSHPQPLPSSAWTPSHLSLYQTHFNGIMDRTDTAHKAMIRPSQDVAVNDTMIVSRELWNEIEEALDKGHVEEAILLACCDDYQPAFAVGLNGFESIQEKHQLHSSEHGELLHFCLQLASYTQCTSPLRRYVDFETQRRLVHLLHQDIRKLDCDYEVEIIHTSSTKEAEAKQFEDAVSVLRSSGTLMQQYYEGFAVQIDDFQIVVKFLTSVLGDCTFPIRLSELGTSRRPKNKLEWTMRYYDVDTQGRYNNENVVGHEGNARDELGRYFAKRTVVKTQRWKKFIGSLQRDCSLENLQRVGKVTLRRVLESITDQHEEPQNDSSYRALLTSNGVAHGRKIVVDAAPYTHHTDTCTSLYFQFGKCLEKGVLTFLPQLLYLTPHADPKDDLDVCLSHRRHATVFDVDYIPHGFNERDFERKDKKLFLYYKKWMSLVRLDGIYSSVHSNSSTILHVKNVTITRSENGSFTLGRKFCENCFVTIRKGDFLCIRAKNKSHGGKSINSWVAHGVIEKVFDDENKPNIVYHFKLFKSVETPTDKAERSGNMVCEIIPLNVSHRRMAAVLMSLKKANSFVKAICVGKYRSLGECTTPQYQSVENLDVGAGCVGTFSKQINVVQRDQIKKALRSRVTLIQGPPGTGKSFMGAHLAYYFRQLNSTFSREGKILYCGPSNKSVDVVAEYLEKIPSLKCVRVYGSSFEERDFPIPIKPSRIIPEEDTLAPTLKSVALHYVIRKDGKPHARKLKEFDDMFQKKRKSVTLENYKEYAKLLQEAKTKELQDQDIILCTCITAGSKLVSDLTFEQCIIDESGMCSEPESLVPIVTAAKNQNVQITLIGDHKQLQPIVTCRDAARGGLDKSLFERLEGQGAVGRLTVQYRMHSTIRQFPSGAFYESQLTDDNSLSRRLDGILHYPEISSKNTAFFCHVEGYEEEDEFRSKYNIHQAKITVKLLEYLLIYHKVNPANIMTLSPYLAQCKKIKQLIKRTPRLVNFQKHLHIGSVVTSQGSEADYVILSTVRSSETKHSEYEEERPWMFKHIGFVTDDHQINVAITRAKLGLCIIGNMRLLAKHKTWGNLISGYQKRGAVMDEEDAEETWSFIRRSSNITTKTVSSLRYNQNAEGSDDDEEVVSESDADSRMSSGFDSEEDSDSQYTEIIAYE